MNKVNEQAGPALFFCVDGNILYHGCSVNDGEPYGDFINYPRSHYEVWEQHYASVYRVDFDFYPRGRVVYRRADDTFLIYCDRCMEQYIHIVTEKHTNRKYKVRYDEHYQCHNCNDDYVV